MTYKQINTHIYTHIYTYIYTHLTVYNRFILVGSYWFQYAAYYGYIGDNKTNPKMYLFLRKLQYCVLGLQLLKTLLNLILFDI